ncbi:MAG: CatB-related O-acetyltransferase [Defluviitaleaceae bacterium]|nr:CatB-related O-acetyltransferase [Defluviitaleaceae bacterium]
MKTRLAQVLDRHLNGREIAVWGNPTRRLLRELRAYKFHIAYEADPAQHYVITVTEDDEDDFFCDEQNRVFKMVEDYIVYEDEGSEIPFEWNCYGTKVGRQSYFGVGILNACKDKYIESIGHFTSINSTAKMAVNHQLNMVFTSDEIEDFFSEENATEFDKKLDTDPAHPYAKNKPQIKIGNDVYIGAHAFINASKVTSIGDGAIIGTGAVVLEDVPPYAVVTGVPAKIKRYRFPPDMIKILLRVKWWDWSIDEINKNADALMSPEIFKERFGTP